MEVGTGTTDASMDEWLQVCVTAHILSVFYFIFIFIFTYGYIFVFFFFVNNLCPYVLH